MKIENPKCNQNMTILNRDLQLTVSLLIILSFYSFDNFGFLNLFDSKLLIQIFLLALSSMPILLLIFYNFKISMLQEPVILLLLYLILSGVFLSLENLGHLAQLIVSLLFSIILFILRDKYIDFILKGIIIICTFFSILAISQFILLQLDTGFIDVMHMHYTSGERYVNLSHSHWFNYLGFGVLNDWKTFLGIEFIRLRSFSSEPSVLVHSFYAVGILSILFSKFYRFMGVVILTFTIIIAYPGVVHLSLTFSFLFYLLMILAKLSLKSCSLLIILFIYLLFFLTILFDPIFFIDFTPSNKEGSAFVRLNGIAILVKDILSNPFFNFDIPIVPPVGFLIDSALLLPIVGLSISTLLFKRIFFYIINIYYNYKLFSILIAGMMIQVAFFSSYGWQTFPGFLMISLIYIKLKSLTNLKKL